MIRADVVLRGQTGDGDATSGFINLQFDGGQGGGPGQRGDSAKRTSNGNIRVPVEAIPKGENISALMDKTIFIVDRADAAKVDAALTPVTAA